MRNARARKTRFESAHFAQRKRYVKWPARFPPWPSPPGRGERKSVALRARSVPAHGSRCAGSQLRLLVPRAPRPVPPSKKKQKQKQKNKSNGKRKSTTATQPQVFAPLAAISGARCSRRQGLRKSRTPRATLDGTATPCGGRAASSARGERRTTRRTA